jgi:hypothetical protein
MLHSVRAVARRYQAHQVEFWDDKESLPAETMGSYSRNFVAND